MITLNTRTTVALFFLATTFFVLAVESSSKIKKNKNIADMTDEEIENIYAEWEVNLTFKI